MMAALARGLSAIGGSWLTVPALIGLLIIAAHQWKENRDGRLKAEGKQQCDASWELAISREERDAAAREAKRAKDILEGERQVTERLQHDLRSLESEFAAHKANAGSDPNRLSDGVLDVLRKRHGVGSR